MNIVSRMEAYSGNSDVFDGGNSKHVRVVAQNTEVDKRIKKLEDCITQQKREIERLKSSAPPRYYGSDGGPSYGPPCGSTAGQDCGQFRGHAGASPAAGAAAAAGWHAACDTGQ